jgi:hypothetical protein
VQRDARENRRWDSLPDRFTMRRKRHQNLLALGILICKAFREKRQQANSCDAPLTSTPTTTISATVGGAFIFRSFDRGNFATSTDFICRKTVLRPSASDSSARRSLADASVNGDRTVVHPLQTVRSTINSDDNRTHW